MAQSVKADSLRRLFQSPEWALLLAFQRSQRGQKMEELLQCSPERLRAAQAEIQAQDRFLTPVEANKPRTIFETDALTWATQQDNQS
jgi:hypothetical protein